MTAKVATREAGNARLRMSVAETFLRNTKMTRTTSMRERTSVNLTSSTESRMAVERSDRILRNTEGGNCSWKPGMSALTSSTTWTTLVPGCLRIESVTLRSQLVVLSVNQLAFLSASIPS